MSSKTNFYFSRIKFNHQMFGLDSFMGDSNEELNRVDKIREHLFAYTQTPGPVIEMGDSKWRFGRVEEYEGLIIGKFGKVYTDKPMQYDDDVGDFIESQEDEELADVSFFIIFPELQVIAFNRRKRIGYRQFNKAFRKGYSKFQEISNAMMLTLLKDSTQIQYILQEADAINSVDFTLTPTNPIRDDDMQILDQPMREMDAKKIELSAHAKNGLNYESPFMKSGFALSNNGYGDFIMDYEVDDQRKIYNSTDQPAKHETDTPPGVGALRERADELADRIEELTVTDGEDVVNTPDDEVGGES